MAQVLSDYGYTTWAFGKWHNTPPSEVTKLGPFDNWPIGLGFNYFYGFMAGETSQYEPRLFEICSDNGASGEGVNGTISELLAQNGMVTTVQQQIKVLDQDYGGLDALGGPKVDNMYHHGWAWAGDTPPKYTKLIASHFGGTRTPLAISWPKEIKPEKTPRPQFTHVNDIAPTIYEILNITPPRTVDGVPQDPLDGISMVYSFADAKAPDRKHTQYFEIMGSRGIYHDGWMASAFGPKVPWRPDLTKLMSWTPDKDVWELYKIDDDFSQADDLAAKEPAKLASMKELFTIEAAKNNVFPVGGGLYTILNPLQ